MQRADRSSRHHSGARVGLGPASEGRGTMDTQGRSISVIVAGTRARSLRPAFVSRDPARSRHPHRRRRPTPGRAFGKSSRRLVAASDPETTSVFSSSRTQPRRWSARSRAARWSRGTPARARLATSRSRFLGSSRKRAARIGPVKKKNETRLRPWRSPCWTSSATRP